MKMGKFSVGVLIVFLAGTLAWTQSLATSKVTGTIMDQSGAIVPGAKVQLTETDNGQVHTVTSNSAGSYIVPDLPAGPYRLEVTSAGFAKYVQNGIVLNVGTNPTINVSLQVGAATQEVTVEASALMVETQSNGVGQVIDQKQVVELPLNGRDPMQLISLAGATTAAPAGDLNTNKNFPTITIAVAGGLPNGVAYILDGGSNNDPFNNLNMPMPFPDALMEFKVQTSALPAQYGDHAAAAVNAVTKSGGNTFHGDVFEFVRNYMFNAANFFGYNSATGAKVRDSLKRNQFGGVFGGPIKRDKLFFFAGYQGTIVRSNPPNSFVQAPTTAMMNGDFSQVAAPVSAGGCQKTQVNLAAPFGTVNGKPNQINPSQFSSAAIATLKSIPIATASTDVSPSVGLPVGCGYVLVQVPANNNLKHGLGRVDYNVSEKQRLFARYFIGVYDAPVPQVPGNALNSNAVSQYNRDQTLTIGDTYSFSANVVNAIHLTGRRTLGLRNVASFFDPTSLGIDAYTRIPGFIGMSVTGGFNLGAGATNPGYFNSTSEQITEDIDIIRGKHEIGIGADYIYALMNTVNNRPTNGIYSFTGSTLSYTVPASPSAACLANPSGLTCTAGSIGYADFLAGRLDSFQQGNPDFENDGQMYFALYGQDSWKPTNRLTVNIGLRWEPYTPEHNSDGHVQNFSMADFLAGKKSQVYANAPAGMSFQGDPGYPGNHYTFGKKNIFVPRIGLVFDPMGDGKMTVRASYGMFYDSPQMFFNTRYSNSPPWGDTISLTGPLSFTKPWATYPGGNPFPALNTVTPTSPFPTAGIYVNSPLHVKPMYMQQWNLSVERQFGSWLLAGSYLGNTTKHLPTSYEMNPAIYAAGATTGNTNARRLLTSLNPTQGAYYATIGMYDDGGIANYNGMLVSVQHRAKNFNLVANYTLAHCLSEAETTELTGPSYLIPPSYNPNGRAYSYSNCDSDHRQIVNVSSVVSTPQVSNHFANVLVHGWQLSPIFSATTGGFGTVTVPSDIAFSGEGNQIANIVGNPYGTRTRFGANGYLVASSFASPPNGTYSLQKPLTIKGPASYQLDMGLARTFKVPKRESDSIQFRWEVFNVANEAIFTGAGAAANGQAAVLPPSGAFNGSSFGNFTTANNPRIMQFALKYIF